jgi:hypothetical protein
MVFQPMRVIAMRRRLQTEEAPNEHVEVKVGSRSVIVEQSELNNLIEALSEMNTLAASGRALMNTASS